MQRKGSYETIGDAMAAGSLEGPQGGRFIGASSGTQVIRYASLRCDFVRGFFDEFVGMYPVVVGRVP